MVAKWSTFVARICETHFVSLLRRRFAKKRWPGTEITSLFEQLHDPDLLEPVQRYATEEDRGARWVRQHDLKLDVRQVLEGLPQHLRLIAYGLQNDTVSGVAESLGMNRTAMYRAIADLRRHLHDAGLHEYLGES